MARPSFAERLHRPATDDRDPEPAVAPAPEPVRPVYATQVAVEDVVSRLADSAHDELGGTAVDPTVVTTLRRRAGKGRPLDGTGVALGSAMGISPGAVRVHADQESDTIARSMQAKAFTYGSDIYFTQGSYDTASKAGRHVLAHELGHVAQGRSGAYGGSPVIGRVDDPAERDADRLADLALSTLGAGSAPVSGVPEDVQEGRQLPTVRRLFGKLGKKVGQLKNKIDTVFGKAKPLDHDNKTGNTVVDDEQTHDQRVNSQRRARGGSPGENPDYSEPGLFGQDPNRFVVTIAAAQEDAGWMNNVDMLKKAALDEIKASPREFVKNLSGAEKRLARAVLLKQGKLDGKSESRVKKLVNQFTEGIHKVGHTWIRLQTYVAPTTGTGKKAKPTGKGQLKELYSYGMWPQKIYNPKKGGSWHGGYGGPLEAGPGEVRHPDHVHESDESKAYKDYEVTEAQFDKALDTAVGLYNSPPPYVLTGYNCTAFAREVLMAAGKPYPGAGILPGFAYTPGNLYWAIMEEWAEGNPDAHTMEREEEAMGKAQTRAKTFVEAGGKNVRKEYRNRPGMQRQRFLKEGLPLYQGNGLGPPTGLNDLVISELGLPLIPKLRVEQTVGDWSEIVSYGDYYWVYNQHLHLFQNPDAPSTLFDDEKEPEVVPEVGETGGGGGTGKSAPRIVIGSKRAPRTTPPREKPKDPGAMTPEEKLPAILSAWGRIGYDFGHLEDILPYSTQQGLKFTDGDLRALLAGPDGDRHATEIAKVLGGTKEELLERWGPRR